MHNQYIMYVVAAAAIPLMAYFCLDILFRKIHVSSSLRDYPTKKQHFHQDQPQKEPEEKSPNILLLFPDQWRYDWDGRDPNLPLELPTIRKLQRDGTHFLHAYVPSPLCAPGRACLASGLEYDQAGVPTNQHNDYDLHIPTFYTALRDTYHYQTFTVGKDDLTKASKLGTKTHQGNWTGLYHQHELGFSEGSQRCSGKIDVVSSNEPHERYGHWLKEQPIVLKNDTAITGWDGHVVCMNQPGNCTSELYPDSMYEDDFVTRQALFVLKNAQAADNNNQRPWFLQVNFPGPHPPFLVTPKQYKAVQNKTFPPPVDNPQVTKPETCISHQYTRATSRCNYAAEMENLDKNIQRILNAIQDDNDKNDATTTRSTIVCFSSDHGEMLLDHKWNGKTVPWQASVSVPLICKGPGIRAGAVIERPVSTMDLAATFLDYAARAGSRNIIYNKNVDAKEDDDTGTAFREKSSTMTSQSLRRLLETGKDDDYRAFVSSGLQGMPFGETNSTGLSDWRMVVEASTGLKLVCCKGNCPGAPSTIPSINKHGYQLALIDTIQDPFDMKPLNEDLPIELKRLRALLPKSFGCK